MTQCGAMEDMVPTQIYEVQIICKWGVVLEGFTKPMITNPGNIGTSLGLNRLVSALQQGHCYWKVLDNEEWQLRKDAYEEKVLKGTAIKCKRCSDAKSTK